MLDRDHCGAALVVVLRDVVAAVAGSDDCDFLSVNLERGGCVAVLRAVVDDPVEGWLTRKCWYFRLAGMAGTKDDIPWMKGALDILAIGVVWNGHARGGRGSGVGRGRSGGEGPNVDFHDARVSFEPGAQFVFGRKGRPGAGKGR